MQSAGPGGQACGMYRSILRQAHTLLCVTQHLACPMCSKCLIVEVHPEERRISVQVLCSGLIRQEKFHRLPARPESVEMYEIQPVHRKAGAISPPEPEKFILSFFLKPTVGFEF